MNLFRSELRATVARDYIGEEKLAMSNKAHAAQRHYILTILYCFVIYMAVRYSVTVGAALRGNERQLTTYGIRLNICERFD